MIAVLSCSLFTGAAVYVSLVEHPARIQCGLEIAATEFAPSYRRATVMQVISAALGLLSPFTLIVILPTNKQLLSLMLDK